MNIETIAIPNEQKYVNSLTRSLLRSERLINEFLLFICAFISQPKGVFPWKLLSIRKGVSCCLLCVSVKVAPGIGRESPMNIETVEFR